MRKAKVSSFQQGIALLLCVLLGCGGTITGSQQSRLRQLYDGETLFRGLFFGEGPVARLFPEIWDSAIVRKYQERSPGSPERSEMWKTRIISELAQDGTFFTQFAADVQSGDHLRVEQAMRNGAQRVLKIVSPEGELERLVEDLTPAGLIITDIAVAVEILAAVVVAVAAVAFAVFFFGASQEGSSSVGTAGSGLKHDFWIDLIATRIGPDADAAR